MSLAAWKISEILPDTNRDPIDRMLVAHAMTIDMPSITANSNIMRYPARVL